MLTEMAAVVDGVGHSLSKIPADPNETDEEALVDVGPLVGRERGFWTRESLPTSGGLGGMEMVEEEESGWQPTSVADREPPRWKGKRKSIDGHVDVEIVD